MANEETFDNVDSDDDSAGTEPITIVVKFGGDTVTWKLGTHMRKHVSGAIEDGATMEMMTELLAEMLQVGIEEIQETICPSTPMQVYMLDPESLQSFIAAAAASEADDGMFDEVTDDEISAMLDKEKGNDSPA